MISGNVNNGKSIGEIMADFKEEIKDFANTRYQMLRTELTEKAGAWRTALPALLMAFVFACIGLFLVTGFLVALVAMVFRGSAWAIPAAFGIVAVVYLLVAAVAGAYGYSSIKANGMKPERTLRVLKQDQMWLQTEAKTQL